MVERRRKFMFTRIMAPDLTPKLVRTKPTSELRSMVETARTARIFGLGVRESQVRIAEKELKRRRR